jgi:hypothetical protein
MRTALQQAIPKERFVRALGRAPLTRRPRVTVIDRFDLFTETFGPPERKARKHGTFFVWNFIRIDQNGNQVFSLASRIPNGAKLRGESEISVDLMAESGSKTFTDWAWERLGAVCNGEEMPRCVGAGNYAITRM